ncbi:MAG TPA: arginine--tRNA ligase [Firmicutes bacterium]|nr:arginine--tRNA ligase [Bacillota bacterium]
MDATKKQEAQIVECIRQALATLGLSTEEVAINLEVPADKQFGDYATNVAMTLARTAKMVPRQLAERICGEINIEGTNIRRVEVAGPGFINFYLKPSWLHQVLRDILFAGPTYGNSNIGANQRVLLEFVSANPTGPMNVVNARAAAVGDCLANIMAKAGYEVAREYYVNDAGNQADRFALSLEVRFRQLLGEDIPFIEDGYPGEYVIELAKQIRDEHPELVEMEAEDRIAWFKIHGVDYMVEAQKQDLSDFGVDFDRWFRERDLHTAGKVSAVIEELEKRGVTYREEGALWFRSTDFGDDKDRVVVRADGTPTYLAADIAYHLDKFHRGYTRLIDIWGPDHHGYIARTKAAVQALGYAEEDLEIIILQLVRLMRGGEQVRMSKRAGEFVTMQELLEEVGKDAARYFFIMRSPTSHLDFDLDLAKEQSQNNPVYYVQYAHARICSILREATQLPDGDLAMEEDALSTEYEVELMKKLAQYPVEIEMAAERREPHRLPRYAHEVAALFHSFYTHCRVLGDPQEQPRLLLVMAVKEVLANALGVMGISAPTSM